MLKNQGEMESLKEAWRDMVVLRTCPPAYLLNSQESEHYFREHMKRCPFCQTAALEQEQDLDAWREIGEVMEETLLEPIVKTPATGQVWSIRQELSGWDRDYRYINAPLILIIEENSDLNAVKVAQVCSKFQLKGPDDIFLREELGFAEPWNVYTISTEDLEYCWNVVEPGLAGEIKETAEQELQEVDESSALFFFRQLELEVGAYFSLQSVEKIMHRLEEQNFEQTENELPQGSPQWLYDNEQLAQIMARDLPGATLPKQSKNVLSNLALMELPYQDTAMAASGSEGIINFNLAQVSDSGMNVKSLLAEILSFEVIDREGWIKGHFLSSEKFEYLYAWWKRDAENFVTPDSKNFDDKYFNLIFKNVEKDFFESGNLILLGITF